LLLRLDEEEIFSFLCKQTLQFYEKIVVHINTAQNLLNIAPRGSKQGFFGRAHTKQKHC